MQSLRTVAILSACCLAASAALAADEEPETAELNVGDPAPSFTLKDDQGQDWKSDEHFGEKIVVIYFYPADMTSGCTKQACGFRDDLAELAGEDVEVVGISGDSVRNHQLFKQAEGLNFTLLADPKGEAAAKFGVPYKLDEVTIEREIDGQLHKLTRTATISRWTFVVDKDGKIALKNDQVKADKDSRAVLEFVQSLE
jgi:peroxiredoxin Q/BCP